MDEFATPPAEESAAVEPSPVEDASPTEPPAEEAPAEPAPEGEMDPELAALLKQLEEPSGE